MHCEQFSDRLNQLLDDRCDPSLDMELASHASDCGDCQRQLDCWRLVDNQLVQPSVSANVLPPCIHAHAHAPSANRKWVANGFARLQGRQRSIAWLTMAAAVCWMTLTFDQSRPTLQPQPPISSSNSTLETAEIPNFNLQQFDLRNLDLRIDEPRWWGEMASASLRPVQPITNGFRPLTNSFQSALQILTPKTTTPPTEAIIPVEDASAQHATNLRYAV